MPTLAGFMRLFSLLDQEYDVDDETLRDRILKARYRADLVTELPASAPGGYLMVKAGDVNLYVGAGMASPLRKIPTQPV